MPVSKPAGLSNLSDSMEAVTKTFRFEGNRIVYDEYGEGDRVVVMMPGLLFSRRMHAPLAASSASTCLATGTRTARPRCRATR